MFASRLPGDLRNNRLTALLACEQSSGQSWLDLTVSNPTAVALKRNLSPLLTLLANPASAHYSPEPLGLLSAREAICTYYRERHCIQLTPEQIVLTSSTSEAYAWLFKLLGNPGQKVLVPRPSYPLFEHLVRLEGLHACDYRLNYDGEWYVQGSSLDEGDAPTSHTSPTSRNDGQRQDICALVAVNPHNPTGMFLSQDDLQKLSAYCNQCNAALISDEVFSDYPLMQDAHFISALDDSSVLTFVLNGFSKLLGLPQLKLSWIVVAGPKAERQEALTRLELIADTFLSVNTPVQECTEALLAQREALQGPIQTRLQQNLSILRKRQPELLGCTALRTEGGWSIILRLPRVKEEELLVRDLLEQARILVQPGHYFDLDGGAFVVISLLVEPSQFSEGLRRLGVQLEHWLSQVDRDDLPRKSAS